MSHQYEGWGELESAYASALAIEHDDGVADTNPGLISSNQHYQQQPPQTRFCGKLWELAGQKVERFRQSARTNPRSSRIRSTVKLEPGVVRETVLHLPSSRSVSSSSFSSSTSSSASSSSTSTSTSQQKTHCRRGPDRDALLASNRKPPRETFLILPSQVISTVPGRNYRRYQTE